MAFARRADGHHQTQQQKADTARQREAHADGRWQGRQGRWLEHLDSKVRSTAKLLLSSNLTASMLYRLLLALFFPLATGLQPPVRVGLAWGGLGESSQHERYQNGRYGCDTLCVDRTEELFQGDARFSIQRIHIEKIATRPELLVGLSILIIPGGDNNFNELYGGAGQLAALGECGLNTIGKAIDTGMVYVGICAGAFLACQDKDGEYGHGLAGPGMGIHDEENFGCASVRGLVDLDISTKSPLSNLIPSWTSDVAYDDSSAMLVDSSVSDTKQLASYGDTVNIMEQHAPFVRPSYWRKAKELIGKAAMTLTRRGSGKLLLVGPHPELSPQGKGEEFLDLVYAVASDDDASTNK